MVKKIIIAGFYRSGSTWLFNAVKQILINAKQPFSQINTFLPMHSILNDNAKFELYKYHDFIETNADFIFTSTRNLEQCKKSYQKCFPSKQTDISWWKLAMENYNRWNVISNYEMKYEDLKLDKLKIIIEISNILGLKVCAMSVLKELEKIKPPTENEYDPNTLLFRNHISN